MDKPNFLFLIADDHRFSALNALGSEAVSTPTFDKLMDEGTTSFPLLSTCTKLMKFS